MTHLDLFSGIGGFALAAAWAGIRTIGFCENDKFCQAVLHKHWPTVPIYDDIKNVRGDEFGTIDIVSAGVPCQPASCAGKRKGKEDDRWLWPETFRIISAVKPTWCLLENVRGLITLDGGLAFENLLSELETLGYETQAFIVPACAVNAPHRRDRVWIVGHTQRSGCGGKPRRGPGEITSNRYSQLEEGDVSNTTCVRTQRRVCIEDGGTKLGGDGDSRAMADTEGQPIGAGLRQGGEKGERGGRLGDSGGKINGWTVKSRLGGMVDGLSRKLDPFGIEPDISRVAASVKNRVDRLKGLGNAIVPQVAFEILRTIKKIEEGG